MEFITFQCYACGQMLKVGADKGGRKAKCHKCGTVLTIPVASAEPPAAPPPASGVTPAPGSPRSLPPPAPAAPAVPAAPAGPTPVAPIDDEELDALPQPRRRRRAEDDDYEDEDIRDRVRRPEQPAWPRVRVGLLLVFIGGCVLAGAVFLQLIAHMVFTILTVRVLSLSSPSQFSVENLSAIDSLLKTFRVLQRVEVFVHLAAALTLIVGYVFCMLGPNRRGSMGLAIATLGAAAVELILTLAFWLPDVFRDPMLQAMRSPGSFFVTWFFGQLLARLALAAVFILFGLYLRAVCLARRADDDAGPCLFLMILGCVYAGLGLLIEILWFVSYRPHETPTPTPRALIWISIILTWIGLLVLAGVVVWFILQVWRTRRAVE
jgi:hypothetical protein